MDVLAQSETWTQIALQLSVPAIMILAAALFAWIKIQQSRKKRDK